MVEAEEPHFPASANGCEITR